MTKRNSAIIDQLATDLKPVKPVPLFGWVGLWSLLAGVIGLWFVRSVGLRDDWTVKMGEATYALASVLFGLATLVSGWFCFRSAIPGAMTKRQHRRAIYTILATSLIAVVSYAGMFSNLPEFSRAFVMHDAIGCCMRISKGMVIPSVILLALTSRLAPTRAWATVWYAVGAGALLTSFVSQLNCPIDNPAHVLIGHGVMVAVTSGLSLWIFGLLFRIVLKWRGL